jgi:hypothetical protein
MLLAGRAEVRIYNHALGIRYESPRLIQPDAKLGSSYVSMLEICCVPQHSVSIWVPSHSTAETEHELRIVYAVAALGGKTPMNEWTIVQPLAKR